MSPLITIQATLIASAILLSGCGGSGGGSSQGSVSTSTAANTINSSEHLSSASVSSKESVNNHKNAGQSSAVANSSSQKDNRLSQTFTFANPVIFTSFDSASNEPKMVVNPITAQGTGSIVYESSNPNVAYVDDAGTVTVIANTRGSVTITATIAADDKYQTASASYVINASTYVVDSYEEMCSPCEQRITFAVDQVNVKRHKVSANNVFRHGSGEIRFTSADPNIATVDKNGLIKGVGIGTTHINVEVAAAGKFPASSAQFTVRVEANEFAISIPPAEVPFSAWVGNQDALITFPESAQGFTFYSSDEENCDFTHVVKCANGQFEWLAGPQLTNTAFTLSGAGYHLLKDTYGHSSFRMVEKATFEPRIRHEVVSFNNSLWLIGGHLGADNFFEPIFKNDVWSSADGVAWTEQTTNGGFSTRVGHKVIAFNNALWLIGGNDWKLDYLIPGEDNGRKNDIWSSIDGITWTQQVPHASFSPRADHQVVVFNNKLWLIGGNDKSGNRNDIWSSSNGITWVQQTANASFSPRSNFQVAVFKNKLWLIGANGDDVWTSVDGSQWSRESVATSFSPREDHKVLVHNNKLWLVGGYDKNDVWSSVDGLTWVQHTEHAAFSPRNHFQLISFDKKLMMIGGSTAKEFNNQVWSSVNGIEWRKGFNGAFQFPQ